MSDFELRTNVSQCVDQEWVEKEREEILSKGYWFWKKEIKEKKSEWVEKRIYKTVDLLRIKNKYYITKFYEKDEGGNNEG